LNRQVEFFDLQFNAFEQLGRKATGSCFLSAPHIIHHHHHHHHHRLFTNDEERAWYG